ncbi:MAG: DNA-deoxyinosine glycosylase [Elusimicrobiota bacterium]|jgi:hypoxanthine-DNA glycosylase|nr:DNA-deoxyinosine glycosylase [Elusimicrobiota bacterium]
MPKSFKYITDAKAKILILGSMPGEASLKAKEYYAYKHNKFWEIIFDAFEEGRAPLDYKDKLKTLKKNNIALWDTLQKCKRKGSLDGNIAGETPNNVPLLLKKYPHIKKLLFNGQAAFKYFVKHFGKPQKDYIVLPSTSPANAGVNFKEKLAKWKAALTDI